MRETKHSEPKLNKSEIADKLKPVAVQSNGRAAVSLFAARTAFRILPILVIDGGFNYWRIGNHDKRLEYLLKIAGAVICAYLNDKVCAYAYSTEISSIVNTTRNAAARTSADRASVARDTFRSDPDAIHDAYAASIDIANADSDAYAAAAAVIEAVKATTDTVEANDSVDAATLVCHFADIAAAIYYSAQKSHTSLILSDLEQLQMGNSLFVLPLLPGTGEPSAEINEIMSRFNNYWLNALDVFAKECDISELGSGDLVHEFSGIYKSINIGRDSQREAKLLLKRLNAIFDYTDVSEDSNSLRPLQYIPNRHQSPEITSYQDHLNRQPLISAVAAVLAHKANCEHQTIGLLGDWGIGKSTWLKLLKKELLKEHKDQAYLFGEFNAWAYEHTDNLQAGIAQEVIKALSSPAPRLEDFDQALVDQKTESWFACFGRWLGWKWERTVLAAKFSVQLNGAEIFKLLFMLLLAVCPVVLGIPEWLSDYLASKAADEDQALYRGAAFVGNTLWVLGFGFYFIKELPKVFANSLAKELLTYLRLPDYAQHLGTIPVMRKNIEILCNVRLKSNSGKSSRLLFVVDDLDRCSHDGVVKVFEAVRLVLDIKNVTVIIAVDQHIALASLALHYEKVAKHHKLENPRAIARDYLAKVIHLPIILANPRAADIETYLQKLWLSSISKQDHEIVEKEQRDFMQKLAIEQQKIESYKRKLVSNSKGINDTKNFNDLDLNGVGVGVVRDGVLSPEDPKEPILSPSNTEEVGQPEVASLSAAQRRAFIYWLNYFGLTNPRQVKRLNNTYNLLLNCYRDVDKLPVATDLPEPMPKSLFSMMMALITMEYLNSMDDQVLRNHLRSRLFLRSAAGEDTDPNVAPLTNEFISGFHLLLDAHNGLVEKVRPFVLPAIEKC